MQCLTYKSQGTDGVWVGRLQNRWFLAVRDACAGKLASLSQWLCVVHFIEAGYLNSTYQARGMACLAMGAGSFNCRFVFMHLTVRLAIFNRKIDNSRRIHCLSCYKINSCHFSRHSLAHPPAQGQQGDHEDENKTTHQPMIG